MVNMPWAITPGSSTSRGEGLVPVDRIEVPGGAGVPDQVLPGNLDVPGADLLADCELREG